MTAKSTSGCHILDDGQEYIWMPGGKGHSKSRLKKLTDIMKEGKAVSDVWTMPIISSSSRERIGYPTQKPLNLLERIIEASSNAGDVVLDPFCGCATACIAAEQLHREWVGIDISPKAAELSPPADDRRTRYVLPRRAPHRRTTPNRPRKTPEVQRTSKPDEAIRGARRQLRRMRDPLRAASFPRGPHHRPGQRRNRSHREEDVKKLVETVMSDSWSFPDSRP